MYSDFVFLQLYYEVLQRLFPLGMHSEYTGGIEVMIL
jgi:hypothetical protein